MIPESHREKWDGLFPGLYWVGGVCGIGAVVLGGFMAWQGNVVNVVAVMTAWLFATFSLGRLVGHYQHDRLREGHHATDPCVVAGEHVEGCIFAVEDLQTSVEGSAIAERTKEEDMEGTTTISMCMECGALLDDSRSQAKHQGKRVERCLDCASHGLCPANPDGPHQAVTWPEDPEFDPATLDELPGPLPEGERVGYCRDCVSAFWEPQPGMTYQDLTWQDVGRLWAERTNPELLKKRPVEAEIIHYWHEGHSDRVRIRLRDTEGEEYRVSSRAPFAPDSFVIQIIHALGYREGRGVNLDDLLGRWVRLEVEGRDVKEVLPR